MTGNPAETGLSHCSGDCQSLERVGNHGKEAIASAKNLVVRERFVDGQSFLTTLVTRLWLLVIAQFDLLPRFRGR